MKTLRHIGSLAFVLGLFVSLFAGIPWYVLVAEDPVIPWWLRVSIFSLLGGILIVLGSLALDQKKMEHGSEEVEPEDSDDSVLVMSSNEVPGKEIKEVLGLVQGHTVFAVWLGKDLSAIVRLILGGELTEYTEMMGSARSTATQRMIKYAGERGADAIINVRYMTTSVIGSAAELLVYGTAVTLTNSESAQEKQ